MLTFPFSPSAVFLLATLSLFASNIFSQENRPFRHSNEIGVDFAPFLRGESGVSILYKRVLGKTTDVETKKRNALRLLMGYYDYAHDYSITLRQVGDTTFLLEGSGHAKHRFLLVGAENQTRKKNLRFNIGADAGYRYWTSLDISQHVSLGNGMSFVTEQTDIEREANVVVASFSWWNQLLFFAAIKCWNRSKCFLWTGIFNHQNLAKWGNCADRYTEPVRILHTTYQTFVLELSFLIKDYLDLIQPLIHHAYFSFIAESSIPVGDPFPLYSKHLFARKPAVPSFK